MRPPPPVQGIDHIHVFVSDRASAERWYARVLGFRRLPRYEHWAAEGGPLTLCDADESLHIALFEGNHRPSKSTTVALRVDAANLLYWQAHLARALDKDLALVDHDCAWSLYFSDPWDNPFELITYEYEQVQHRLEAAR